MRAAPPERRDSRMRTGVQGFRSAADNRTRGEQIGWTPGLPTYRSAPSRNTEDTLRLRSPRDAGYAMKMKQWPELTTEGNGTQTLAVPGGGPAVPHGTEERAGEPTEQEPILDHSAYLEERKSLKDAKLKIEENLDKSVLAISTGALGVSLTFIEKIAPNPARESLLAWAWGLWAATFCASLLSGWLGQCSYERAIENLDREQREKKPFEVNHYAAWTRWVTFASLVLLVAGVVCFTVFTYVNLPRKRTEAMSKHERISEVDIRKGSPAPPRPVPAPAARPEESSQTQSSTPPQQEKK
jgi:hypothetical protein